VRILLIGASGLIGSALAARLQRDGHEVTGVGRSGGAAVRRLPLDSWIMVDLRAMVTAGAWLPHLAGVEAVVNAAGVLQDNFRDSTAKVHRDAPSALWKACGQAGVRRIVQISAIGVDRGGTSAFSRSKAEGDRALEASGLDWVILRPSVVLGRAAYGGSALLRGLAALPLRPRTRGAGPLDIVQLDDVAETVARLVRPDAPSRMALDLAGPERLAFDDVVAAYRAWFGWRPARLVSMPGWVEGLAWRAGDLVARLGWRPPIRTTARIELARGATGDSRAWIAATGIRPQSLGEALAAAPASVQERWFALLYPLKPLAILVLASFWLVSGIVSLGPGLAFAENEMRRVGGALSVPLTLAGSAADILIGAAILYRPSARPGLRAALLLSLLYLVAGTFLAPDLWRDPLGPLLKIAPIMVLNLFCLAILDER
jgi:uncharacterized protein YbjT (DUF2867 family)